MTAPGALGSGAVQSSALDLLLPSHPLTCESHAATLVHCGAGVSRSSCLCMAYLMRSRRWNAQTALDHCKARRSVATSASISEPVLHSLHSVMQLLVYIYIYIYVQISYPGSRQVCRHRASQPCLPQHLTVLRSHERVSLGSKLSPLLAFLLSHQLRLSSCNS